MNKQVSLIFLACSLSLSSFCMEKPHTNRLEQKYHTPVDWQSFETEDLSKYRQNDVAPFLFKAINQKAPSKVVKKILDEKELSANARDAHGNLALTQAILNNHEQAAIVLIRRKAKVVYEMDLPCYSGNNDEYATSLTPWQAACIIGQQKYLKLLYQQMDSEDQHWIVRQPMFHLDKQFPMDYALIHRKPELAQFLCTIDIHLLSANYDYQRAANAAGWLDATYLKWLFENIGMFLESDKDRLLHTAVEAENVEGVSLLIGKGAQTNARMFACAAMRENKELLDELCKGKVNPKEKEENFPASVLSSLFSSHLKSTAPFRLLLAANKPMGQNVRNCLGESIHPIANKYFDLPLKIALIQFFRDNGVKLDTPDSQGRTLLHHTCDEFHNAADDQCMFYLLDLGADSNCVDSTGQTPFLMFCKSNRNPTKLQKFMDCYAPDVNTEDHQENTPLVYAAAQGKKAFALISILRNYDADMPQSCDKMLRVACKTLNVDLARLLIETYGANVKTIHEGRSTLMVALSASYFAHKGGSFSDSHKIERAKMALIDLLIKHGVEINSQDQEGNTSLHYAVKEDRTSGAILAKLLAHGADAAIRNNDKKTPLEISLHAPAYCQDRNKTALLLAHTKENPIILSSGQTPVEYLLTLKRSSFDSGTWNRKLLELFAGHKNS